MSTPSVAECQSEGAGPPSWAGVQGRPWRRAAALAYQGHRSGGSHTGRGRNTKVYMAQAQLEELLSVSWMSQLSPDCEEPCLAKKLALLSMDIAELLVKT